MIYHVYIYIYYHIYIYVCMYGGFRFVMGVPANDPSQPPNCIETHPGLANDGPKGEDLICQAELPSWLSEKH